MFSVDFRALPTEMYTEVPQSYRASLIPSVGNPHQIQNIPPHAPTKPKNTSIYHQLVSCSHKRNFCLNPLTQNINAGMFKIVCFICKLHLQGPRKRNYNNFSRKKYHMMWVGVNGHGFVPVRLVAGLIVTQNWNSFLIYEKMTNVIWMY